VWDAGLSLLITREGAASGGFSWADVSHVLRLRAVLVPLWLAAISASLVAASGGEAPAWGPLLLFALASISNATSAIPLAILRSRLQFGRAAAVLAVGKWAALLPIAVTLFAGWDVSRGLTLFAAAVLLGEITSLIGAIILAAPLVRAAMPPRPVVSLRAALPWAANSFITVSFNRYDVLLLAILSSVSQVAFYAPATRLQDALSVFPATLGLVALPALAALWRNKDTAQMRRTIATLTIVGVCMATIIAALTTLLAPELIRIGLGAGYEQAVLPLRILVWFLPLSAAVTPMLMAITASGGAADVTKVLVVVLACAILLHVVLDPHWGAVGASWASLGREPVLLVGVVWFYRRRYARSSAAMERH